MSKAYNKVNELLVYRWSWKILKGHGMRPRLYRDKLVPNNYKYFVEDLHQKNCNKSMSLLHLSLLDIQISVQNWLLIEYDFSFQW